MVGVAPDQSTCPHNKPGRMNLGIIQARSPEPSLEPAVITAKLPERKAISNEPLLMQRAAILAQGTATVATATVSDTRWELTPPAPLLAKHALRQRPTALNNQQAAATISRWVRKCQSHHARRWAAHNWEVACAPGGADSLRWLYGA